MFDYLDSVVPKLMIERTKSSLQAGSDRLYNFVIKNSELVTVIPCSLKIGMYLIIPKFQKILLVNYRHREVLRQCMRFPQPIPIPHA